MWHSAFAATRNAAGHAVPATKARTTEERQPHQSSPYAIDRPDQIARGALADEWQIVICGAVPAATVLRCVASSQRDSLGGHHDAILPMASWWSPWAQERQRSLPELALSPPARANPGIGSALISTAEIGKSFNGVADVPRLCCAKSAMTIVAIASRQFPDYALSVMDERPVYAAGFDTWQRFTNHVEGFRSRSGAAGDAGSAGAGLRRGSLGGRAGGDGSPNRRRISPSRPPSRMTTGRADEAARPSRSLQIARHDDCTPARRHGFGVQPDGYRRQAGGA